MNKYYHFTNYSSLNSIKIDGLKPQNGVRCQSIGDGRTCVFLSKGIDNSIIMYSLMLGLYNKYIGEAGDEAIRNNIAEIEKLDQELEQGVKYKYVRNMIIESKKVPTTKIKRINLIRSFRNFNDYLGGDGCFLSINGLDDSSIISNSEDCWCMKEISPNNISVVGLRNKFINQYTDSREAILAYFMFISSIDKILKLVPDDRKNNIYQLYDYIYRYLGYTYCNPYYYELIETPINYYNTDYQKIKTLDCSETQIGDTI